MYCSKCGAKNDSNVKFCSYCGSSIVDNNQQNNTVTNTNVNVQPVNHNQNKPTPNVNKPKQTSVGMIVGIVSLVLGFFLNILIVPVALVGLIISIVEKNKKGKAAGIIINILGIIIPIGLLLISFVAVSDYLEKAKEYSAGQVFKGDGYELTYDVSWTKGTYAEKDVLAYNFAEDTYFLPIGRSKLTDLSCDFSEMTCKNKMYDDFYNLWGKELKNNSLTLYKDSFILLSLKDDMYYGTYSYGKSSEELMGQYYVVVSEEDNVVLSFFTRTKDSTITDLLETSTLSLLKTIEITESEENLNSDENVIYDDELAGMLDSMSNWNRYSNLRTGELGKKTNINGGWRILSDSETYWEFKNNTFYWYKSVNDLKDNYWYGTTKVLTGKAGFREVGLDESNLDNIITRSKGKVTANDVYTVVCTPTKIITDGVDKSSTNIPAGTKWNYVWIIVDHGKEGIEGQVLNVSNSSTSYYVKIKD